MTNDLVSHPVELQYYICLGHIPLHPDAIGPKFKIIMKVY